MYSFTSSLSPSLRTTLSFHLTPLVSLSLFLFYLHPSLFFLSLQPISSPLSSSTTQESSWPQGTRGAEWSSFRGNLRYSRTSHLHTNAPFFISTATTAYAHSSLQLHSRLIDKYSMPLPSQCIIFSCADSVSAVTFLHSIKEVTKLGLGCHISPWLSIRTSVQSSSNIFGCRGHPVTLRLAVRSSFPWVHML